MAESSLIVEKKLIRIDVSSDTVCPWCFVGKRNMEKAMDIVRDQFDFQVWWHPFLLNPSTPKEGVAKSDFYKRKFGSDQSERILARMGEVFRGLGLQYDTSGLIGNTMDSHRLISFAGRQGWDKQNHLVEELFLNYFTEGKHIGDHRVLKEAAVKAGVTGAAELLEDPNEELKEVNDEIEKYSSHITGVPYFLINGKHKLSGAQPPDAFLRAFNEAASDIY